MSLMCVLCVLSFPYILNGFLCTIQMLKSGKGKDKDMNTSGVNKIFLQNSNTEKLYHKNENTLSDLQ